ncbi:MAG: hypothetical protein JOZ69_14555 [Myxococcales bacterium]|nr:hypothetical protein [Myxococcales bacterium]
MSRPPRAILLLACCAAAGWSTSSRASESSDAESKAAAQVLFEEGRMLVANNQFAAACPKFAESQRLDPGIGTELWLADCYENNGQTASAWVTFKEAAAAAALVHDQREGIARSRVAALEGRVPRLMIVVPPSLAETGLEIRRDGVPISHAAWGLDLPVDPGVHTVSASAPGRTPWSTTVLVAAATPLQVTIPAALEAAPRPPEQAEPRSRPDSAASAGSAEVAPTPPQGQGRAERPIGVALAAAGVAGLATGTYFSFDAKATYDASNRDGHCNASNQCDPSGKRDRD